MSAKLIIACGTGIATSTYVSQKIKTILEKEHLEIDIIQCRISEIESIANNDDIIIATSIVPSNIKAKVFNGIPFLTGVSEENLMNEITEEIKKRIK
jgi:PTS system galactitol-specific IIB component